MKPFNVQFLSICALSSAVALSGCSNSSSNPTEVGSDAEEEKAFQLLLGTDLNSKVSPALSLNPGGPGGSSNQSLRAGDILVSDDQDTTIIGGLGVDVLVGQAGDDILIGGTEDFNSSVDGDGLGADNRDRAFGQAGDDVFIWAPGDGSDFFDGGEGVDVLVFGVLGESRDSDGSEVGAPFFNVNPPNVAGSQDFDGIFLNDQNKPVVSVSGSPGFCSVIDSIGAGTELELLDLDQIVRFSIRGIANDFDAGIRTDDDGLRVAVSAKDVEFLVCTPRVTIDDGGLDNVEVLDLRTAPPTLASLSDLPEHISAMIQ